MLVVPGPHTVGGGRDPAGYCLTSRAEPSTAPDCLQPTLVPRCGFRQQVSASVSAPSEAWRFLQGGSPCGVRSNQPLLPSVAAVKEVQAERHRGSVHRVPRRPQGRPPSLKLDTAPVARRMQTAMVVTLQKPTQRTRCGERPEGLSGSPCERGRRGEKRQARGRPSWCLRWEPQGGLAERGAEDHEGVRTVAALAMASRDGVSETSWAMAHRNARSARAMATTTWGACCPLALSGLSRLPRRRWACPLLSWLGWATCSRRSCRCRRTVAG